MSCKYSKLEGNTTKFLYCTLFDKEVDSYKCKNCLMKLENKEEKANEIIEQIFGKGFSK